MSFTPLHPAAREWPLVAALTGFEARLGARAENHGPIVAGLYEFLRFGVKQGWACLFGGLLLGLIMASRLWYPAGAALSRYDALVLAALAIQVLLLAFRLETVQEAKVILLFHVVGTAMELFKTKVGSWSYPEANLLRIGGVPLFSGFMYAAVGSYLFRVWRLFDFRFDRHPRPAWLVALSLAIYANFFADHWGLDFRWELLAIAAALILRTTIWFKVWRVDRRMPLLLGFLLVAAFIWFGENLGTAGHALALPQPGRRLGDGVARQTHVVVPADAGVLHDGCRDDVGRSQCTSRGRWSRRVGLSGIRIPGAHST